MHGKDFAFNASAHAHRALIPRVWMAWKRRLECHKKKRANLCSEGAWMFTEMSQACRHEAMKSAVMHGVCALNMELISVLESEPIHQFTSAGCSGNKVLTPGLDETRTDVIVGPPLLGSRLKQKHHGISDNFISFSEANSGYRSIVNYAKLHLKEHLFGIPFTLVPSFCLNSSFESSIFCDTHQIFFCMFTHRHLFVSSAFCVAFDAQTDAKTYFPGLLYFYL